MEDNLIMFSSITLAMRGRDLLKQNRIYADLRRTPVKLKTNSCGYSLYVPKDFDKALQAIRRGGITVLGTAAVGSK